jgi:hypothetical protein
MDSVDLSQNTSLYWIVKDHILVVEIKAQTQNLMHIYDDQVMSCLEASPHVIDLIVVPPPDENKPPSMKQLLSLKSLRHKRLGYVIMTRATDDPIVRFLMHIMSTIAHLKIKGVETVDDALSFLRTARKL